MQRTWNDQPQTKQRQKREHAQGGQRRPKCWPHPLAGHDHPGQPDQQPEAALLSRVGGAHRDSPDQMGRPKPVRDVFIRELALGLRLGRTTAKRPFSTRTSAALRREL